MNRIVTTALAAMLVIAPMAAQAQLVNVDKVYTIKNVDTDHNRLAVKYLNAGGQPVKEQLLVDIDGKTQVVGLDGHQMSWKNLRQNMEVEVKGGLSPGLHIHAKTIMVKKNHV